MDYHGTGLLGDLSPPIKRCSYKGRQQFLDIFLTTSNHLEHTKTDNTSECILFDNVNEQIFLHDFLDPSPDDNDTLLSRSWTTYSAAEQLLLVQVITGEHAAARVAFQDILFAAFEPTGLNEVLQGFTDKTISGTNKSKQGDGGWAPRRPPQGRSKMWPAVVLEVAVSESQSKLFSDVWFWLYESQGVVKIVLALTVKRKSPEVTIEKWELQNNRIHCSQTVGVSKSRADGTITVHNDPLVIEFEKLFLRDSEIPKETDVYIDSGKLENLADAVWCAQDF